ncbi:MAG TPA: translation initiation factor IF-3 [Solirubrobacteraceae bacterium]
MPVPRRFDRRPPDRDTTRINDRIRVPEVRLVGEDGKQIGVVKTADALSYAQERDLDLVEVAPDARPPVCRVLDYSKYKYEQAQKQKAARKHQQQITIREIKFRPKIAQNDYDTKKGHVTRFLRGHDKVKITIMFRGREVTHPERGTALLDRLAGELSEIAVVEQSPLQDGRNMTMLLAPSKAVLAEERGAKPSPEAAEAAEAARARTAPARPMAPRRPTTPRPPRRQHPLRTRPPTAPWRPTAPRTRTAPWTPTAPRRPPVRLLSRHRRVTPRQPPRATRSPSAHSAIADSRSPGRPARLEFLRNHATVTVEDPAPSRPWPPLCFTNRSRCPR